MIFRRTFSVVSCCAVFSLFATLPLAAQSVTSTTFTYQGHLKSEDTAANGSHDFRLSLYDAATTGQQIGSPIEQTGVTVNDGLFALPLDLGAAFDGSGRWLQIEVKAAGATGYTLLSPRQAVTAAPQATFAFNGVPAGFSILGDSETPPPGFTWSGETLGGGEERWINLANCPEELRNVAGAAIIGNSLYVVEDSAVSIYTPATDSWKTNPASLPGLNRSDYSLVAVNGKIYAIGGRIGDPTDKRLDMYDPQTNTWVSKAALPFSLSATNAATVLNGKIHCISYSHHGVYDPVTNIWTSLEDPPRTDRQFFPVTVNEKLYMFDSDAEYAYIYDPALDDGPGGATAWAPIAPLPSRRSYYQPVALNNKIHLLGGYNGSNASYYDYHDIYDPQTNTWSAGLTLPKPTSSYGAGVIDNSIILTGGFAAPHATIKYSPETPKHYLHTRD